jgi:hypothetical protein
LPRLVELMLRKILTTINEDVPNEFMGYSLFEDIINPAIRAWNRANTVYNIKERHGNVVATKYVSKFDKNGKFAIFSVMALVEREGYENIRREIFKAEVNG